MRRILLAVVLVVGVSNLANATVVDLTALGNSGPLNGALFFQGFTQTAGSGAIDSFVRVQRDGGSGYSSGYNVDASQSTFLYNEIAGSFTHSLLLSAVPIVTYQGADYRAFSLDINQNQGGDGELLSLTRVVIDLRSAGNLLDGTATKNTEFTGTAASLFPTGTGVYDSGVGNRVDLRYDFASGSGESDMVMLVPDALFTGPNTQFVYLFSEFGTNGSVNPPYPDNDGYQEWWVNEVETPTNPTSPTTPTNPTSPTTPTNPTSPTTPVPEPASLLLLGSGLALVGQRLRQRRASRA